VKTEIQTYKCKKCGKKFNTEIVEENSNFTHDFKSKCLELVGLFFGSVRNVAYKVKKTHESVFHIKQLKTGYLDMKPRTKNVKIVIRAITFLM